MIRAIVIFFTFTIIAFSACRQDAQQSLLTNDGHIRLAYDKCFKVNDDEQISTSSSESLGILDSLNTEKQNLSLLAHLDHPDYQVYITISTLNKMAALKRRAFPPRSNRLNKMSMGDKFEYRLYQLRKDKSYVAEVVYRIAPNPEEAGEDKIYIIIVHTKGENPNVRQLSRESLISRFIGISK